MVQGQHSCGPPVPHVLQLAGSNLFSPVQRKLVMERMVPSIKKLLPQATTGVHKVSKSLRELLTEGATEWIQLGGQAAWPTDNNS